MVKAAITNANEIQPVEAARALGVELGYVYLLLRSGKLEGRKVGRQWLVSAQAVEERGKRVGKGKGNV